MTAPLRLYARIPIDWNASIYYRLITPMRALAEAGYADIAIDRGDLSVSEETRMQMGAYSSFNMFYQPISDDVGTTAEQMRSFGSYWRTPDEWDVAPHFIIDTDDNILEVDPLNPAFANLGWQIDGTPLESGAVVVTENADGSKVKLYEDGERGFNVEENKKKVASFKRNLMHADLVTCSTREVEKYVLKAVPDANTLVIPNCVRFEDYPKIELADHTDEVRILWQGSPTHYLDLFRIKDSIKKLHDKYPQTTWYFWGGHYEWLYRELDPSRVVLLPWCEYQEYKLRLNMLNFDINLAPLTDNSFNCCRSAIKFYEASACYKPAATLAESTAQFKEDIIDGETGFLYSSTEEFEEKLSKLIEDKQLRARIAQNAQQWVRDNRDIKLYLGLILDKLTHLRETRKALKGEPPRPEIKEPDAEPIPAEQPDIR